MEETLFWQSQPGVHDDIATARTEADAGQLSGEAVVRRRLRHRFQQVRWAVGLSSAAIRTLDQLPPRVVPAIIEFMYGPLADNPRRVGKSLRDDFTGTYGAHRGAYLVLYEIDEPAHSVAVTRVAGRSDAYRPSR